MKKLIVFLPLVAVLTGCGHNAVTFGKGVGFEAGFDPEHFSGRVELLYGEMLNIAARDNLDIELKTDVEGGGIGGTKQTATTTAKTGTALRVRIGQQIAGYTVDAIKAGASAKELIRPMPGESVQSAPEDEKESVDVPIAVPVEQ